MSIPEYKLSTVLCGHSLDVRCVSITKDDCILSSSRDKTTKLWHPEGVKDFTNVVTYKGHTNFVSSVCFLQPCEAYPDGLIVTGSNDTKICAYNFHDPLPIMTFKGHENVVCCVSPSQVPGNFLSSSWDNTGGVWNVNVTDSPIVRLKGHTAAVWGIVELGNQMYATASADKTIIIWTKAGEKEKSLTGHTDCVRALCVVNSDSFLSCGNDASIKLWSNKGDCLNTFYGHSNYIYSICVNPILRELCFVTCGEDSTVRVWMAGNNVCTITLPAQSVWSVAYLSNGDIVAGSSDGVVRVFSADAIRYAEDFLLQSFEQEVAKRQEVSSQEIGGVKVTDLPGPEVLFEPGKSDGQTKLVRKGGSVKCYAWSMASRSWNEVGDVMGAAGASEGKTLHEGKEYDFVFSVDVEDGKPPIKLPYNIGEDPWVSAQAFIHKNFLPQTYLEQVANFIIKNSGQSAGIKAESSGYADPFTGESRYVPGSGTSNLPTVGQNADPFTGASSYSTAASAPPASNANKPTLFPHKSYLKFEQGNPSLILNKMKEFNQKSGGKYTDDNLNDVIKLTDMNSPYNSESIALLKELLLWPADMLFPVLDITRFAIRNAQINKVLCDRDDYGYQFFKILIENLYPDNLPANQLLSLRVLTNSFSHIEGEMLVLEKHEDIINCLICLTQLNKNIEIAATTLLLNICVALGQQEDTSILCNCLLEIIPRLGDNEALFRGLVALGTLVTESPNKIKITSLIVSNNSFMQSLRSGSMNDPNADANKKKVVSCCQQILQVL